MRLSYDRQYTNTFHSPGIEPWICGFLRSRGPFKIALDVGCGLGFTGILLKLYLGNVDYLVGLDISREKIRKLKELGLYDGLVVCDAEKPPFKSSLFDLVIALEVLHGLQPDALSSLGDLTSGSIVLTLPSIPIDMNVGGLLDKGYHCYRYLLRGFVLVDLRSYEIMLATSSLIFKIVKVLIALLKPLIKLSGISERGYILAFK